jgi:hypothetical protein
MEYELGVVKPGKSFRTMELPASYLILGQRLSLRFRKSHSDSLHPALVYTYLSKQLSQYRRPGLDTDFPFSLLGDVLRSKSNLNGNDF